MLRTKYKNISIQFVTLLTLCMSFVLVISLLLTSTHAAQPPQQPYYFVDAYQFPGTVYRMQSRKPSVFFRRQSGGISSIVLWRGQLYFCSANDRRIYQRTGKQQERVVFEHRTYIRDIAVDPSGYLYFSMASGAGGDGRIYKLNPPVNKLENDGHFSIASDSRKDPIQVHLKTVDGFWAGDFTFDAQGNLYLSTGNRSPAFIYKADKIKCGQYDSPQKLFKDTKGAIKGIAIEPNSADPNNPIFIYYADWEQSIHIFNINDLGRIIAFSFPEKKARRDNRHLSDIAFNIRRP